MPKASDAVPESTVQLAARLARNAVDCLPAGGLPAKLWEAESQGRRLRVKLGIDPTAPDIHLGHAVVLRKLREFQDAGHVVVLIVGDYTARVGDPSGRSSQRPVLSAEEIEANAITFHAQAFKILHPDPELLDMRRNSEWLDMPTAELLQLLGTTTAAQLLERDDFAKRWSGGQPISMLELLYPMLQAYDSVAVDADVELGGTDQKFNLLLGRDVQRAYRKPEQAILTMPILVGIDGHRKMSKSLGNQIGITDTPDEMFGKTMSIPDEAIAEYRSLLLDGPAAPGLGAPGPAAPGSASQGASTSEAAAAGQAPAGEGGAPRAGSVESSVAGVAARDAKRALARELVAWLHSPEAAALAEQQFERVHVERVAPDDVEEARFDADGDGLLHLPRVISEAFGISRAEARRLIDAGGVTLGDTRLQAGEHDVAVERADGSLLKVGRRRFRRLRVR